MTGAGGQGDRFVVIDTAVAGRVLPLTGVPGCTGTGACGRASRSWMRAYAVTFTR